MPSRSRIPGSGPPLTGMPPTASQSMNAERAEPGGITCPATSRGWAGGLGCDLAVHESGPHHDAEAGTWWQSDGEHDRDSAGVQQWMTLDLWQALAGDPQVFEAELRRAGWAEIWSQLLARVRELARG